MKLVPKFKTQPIRETVPGKDVAVSITMNPVKEQCAPSRVIDADGVLVTELGCGEEYQLEPCEECPPGGGVCAPDAIGWLVQPVFYNEAGLSVGGIFLLDVVMPSLDYARRDGTSDDQTNGYPTTLRVLNPPRSTARTGSMEDQTFIFYGIPYGNASGIVWEWGQPVQVPSAPPATESDPYNDPWWAGAEFEQVGSFIMVRILPGSVPVYSLGDEWSATITCTAKCGNTTIGELHLVIKDGGG